MSAAAASPLGAREPAVEPAAGSFPDPHVGSAPGWPLILYFHHVSARLRHYTSVTPTEFRYALDVLHERFSMLEPADVEQLSRSAAGPCEERCLITFDDGYTDVFENALPLLDRWGWRAVLFVSTEHVGTVERHPMRGEIAHMDWDQLREAERRGHVVASHGHSHRPFDTLTPEAVQRDVDMARTLLGDEMCGASDWLAYPYGVPAPDGVSLPRLCFGSVKAPARPWSSAPSEVRRTYLPTGEVADWKPLVEGWVGACASR